MNESMENFRERKTESEQGLKVALHNLGCRVNQYEAEALLDKLQEEGFKIVDFSSKADVYIVNSCAVTTSAASKSRSLARRAKRRGGKDSAVIMAGCYSQASPDEVKTIEEVDFLVGSDEKDRLPKIINNIVTESKKGHRSIPSRSDLNYFPDFTLRKVDTRTRANIKVQDGCDQFCSYCIIPRARGPKRSRPAYEAVKEVERLSRRDIKEFVITGIHLGAYGVDLEENVGLAELVKMMLKTGSDFRIRLSSIEALEVSDSLIKLMHENSGLCPHLHLPLQSGSDKILRSMNRPYKVQEYRELIENVRKKIPEIAITTDVMVGFPGETTRDFNLTCEVVKEIEFSRLHVFKYSPRPGTKAADMSERVPGDVMDERSKKLRDLGNRLKRKYSEKFLDNELTVLLERENDDGSYSGYSENYLRLKVFSDSEEDLSNTFQKVKLKEINEQGENLGIICS